MTKSEIVNYACTDKYKSICLRLTKDSQLAQDLHQEMLLVLLEYDEEKILLVKEPKAFIYRILTNMACSSTSNFFKIYKKQLVKERVINFHYENSSRAYHAKLKQVGAAFNSLEQQEKQIFTSFLDMGFATKVSKEYNMPYKKNAAISFFYQGKGARKNEVSRMKKPRPLILFQSSHNSTFTKRIPGNKFVRSTTLDFIP